jgi:hypothetical protein
VCEKACAVAISSCPRTEDTRSDLDGHPLLEVLGDGTVSRLPEGKELGVVGRVREDDDSSVVLGSGTKESHSSNVDLLDGLGDGGRRDLGDGLVERVEVADDDRDGSDLLGLEVGDIRGNVTGEDTFETSVSAGSGGISGKQLTSVDSGVESLDTSTEHLRRASDVGYVSTRGGSMSMGSSLDATCLPCPSPILDH